MAHPMQAMIDGAKIELTKAIEEANLVATRVANADNQAALIHEVIQESDDAQISKYRDWLEKIEADIAAMEKQVTEYIISNRLVDTEPIDVEAETAAYKAQASMVDSFIKALKSIPGFDPAELELPELKRLPGQRGGGQRGPSGPRPRVSKLTVDGVDVFSKTEKDGKEVLNVNFSVLAQFLSKKDMCGTKIEPKDIMQHAFAEAGTSDFKSLNGKPFSFIFPGPNEKNYVIEVTPKVVD